MRDLLEHFEAAAEANYEVLIENCTHGFYRCPSCDEIRSEADQHPGVPVFNANLWRMFGSGIKKF